MAGFQRVGAFASRGMADLAATYLGNHGIQAIVLADDLGGTHPHIALGTGGVALGVPPQDAERARELLADAARPGAKMDAEMDAEERRPLRPVVHWLIRIAGAVVALGILISALPSLR